MAIARLGSILGGISGTLGSVNFANTSQGLILKRALRRVDHATEPQLSQRATFKHFQLAWQDLTDLQRTAWRTAARAYTLPNRLGKPTYLSGFQWFVKLNTIRFHRGPPFYQDPPIFRTTPAITDFTFERCYPGLFFIRYWEMYGVGDTDIYVYGSQPWSSKSRSTYSFWRYLTRGFSWGFSIDVTDEWEAIFGNLVAGQQIALALVNWKEEWLPSAAFTKSTTVTAAP